MQIELLTPHTHAGKRHAAGERIDLPETSATWLISLGTAAVAKPAAAPDSGSKPTRRDTAHGQTTPHQGD